MPLYLFPPPNPGREDYAVLRFFDDATGVDAVDGPADDAEEEAASSMDGMSMSA